MRRVLVVLGIGAGCLAAAPGLAYAAGPSIVVTPSSVPAGGTVTVSGNTGGGCAAGDPVTLLSPAFGGPGSFAGVPAVFATSTATHAYRTTAAIPRNRAPGRYQVTARCGGGTFGIVAHLQVRAAPAAGGTGSGTASDAPATAPAPAAPAAPDSLPSTGAPTGPEIAAGGGVLALGAGLLVATRRRRRHGA